MVAKHTKSRTTGKMRAVGKTGSAVPEAAAAEVAPAAVPTAEIASVDVAVETTAAEPLPAPQAVAPVAVIPIPAKVTKPATRSAAPKPPATPKPAMTPEPPATPKPPLSPAAMAKLVAMSMPAAADALPSFADVATLGRDSVAAVARANAALASGLEAIGQEMAGFAQASMTTAVNTARALVGVRTLADLVAVNRDLAQATIEGMMANSARLSEIGIKMASEAFAPLGERVAAGFGRIDKPAA